MMMPGVVNHGTQELSSGRDRTLFWKNLNRTSVEGFIACVQDFKRSQK